MTFIFDLDYTLLDTTQYKKDLIEILGTTEEDFAYFKKRKINYNVEKHLELLSRYDTREIFFKKNAEVINFLKKIDNYLFPEVKNILKKLSRDHKLILITYGDKDYQELKIKNLEIKKYFKKIIATDQDKSKILEKCNPACSGLKKEDKIIIVNDKLDESLTMQEVLGKNAEIFLIRGPYSKDLKKAKHPTRKLKELLEIL